MEEPRCFSCNTSLIFKLSYESTTTVEYVVFLDYPQRMNEYGFIQWFNMRMDNGDKIECNACTGRKLFRNMLTGQRYMGKSYQMQKMLELSGYMHIPRITM